MANRISAKQALEILQALFERDRGNQNRELNTNNVYVGSNYENPNNEHSQNVIYLNGFCIHLYIVGQTNGYEIESERGHLYSPEHGYPTMKKVNAMDVIFNTQNAMVKSICIALESAERTYGTKDGLRIDCLYNELSNPVDIAKLRTILSGLNPFNSEGYLPRRGYIHALDSRAARILMNEIKKNGNSPRSLLSIL